MLPFGIEDFGRSRTWVHDSCIIIFYPFAQGTVTYRQGATMLKVTRPIFTNFQGCKSSFITVRYRTKGSLWSPRRSALSAESDLRPVGKNLDCRVAWFLSDPLPL
jgi:hypothetical protein